MQRKRNGKGIRKGWRVDGYNLLSPKVPLLCIGKASRLNGVYDGVPKYVTEVNLATAWHRHIVGKMRLTRGRSLSVLYETSEIRIML